MDYGLEGGYGAAGAAEGLQQLLKQRLLEAQLAETTRHNQATEANSAQQIAEQAAWRKLQAEALGDERATKAASTLKGTLPLGAKLDDTQDRILTTGGEGSNIQRNPELAGAQFFDPSMSQPDIVPGKEPGKYWLGDAKQRKEAAAEQQLRNYIATLPGGSSDRFAAEYQLNTGKPAPSALLRTDTTADKLVPVNVGGKVVYARASDAVGQQVGKTETPERDHYTFLQTYNPDGTPGAVIRANTSTGATSPTAVAPIKPAPGAAQMQVSEQKKADARKTLDYLDKDIDNASDLLGPFSGRVSDIESQIGNNDPRFSQLATRMIAAKLQVDAGIGGMKAASSPGLLARWDKVINSRATPENLHAAVQVLREMVAAKSSDSGSGGTGSGKPSAADLIKKYGGGD